MSEENERAPTPIDRIIVVRKEDLASSFKRLAQQLEATAPASMHAVRKYKARRAARAYWPGVNGSITIPERPNRQVMQNYRKTLMYGTAVSIVMIGGGAVVHFYLPL